jgi:hypothetical protein
VTTIVTEEVVVPVPVAVPAAPAEAKATDSVKTADAAKDEATATAFDDKTPADKLPQVPAGATVTLAGKNLGAKMGSVSVEVAGKKLAAEVVKWEPTAATVTLPTVELKDAARARIELVSSEGKVLNAVSVNLLPAVATEPAKTAESKPEVAKQAAGSGIPDLAQAEFEKN